MKNVSSFLLIFFLSVQGTPLQAQESPINQVLAKGRSVVSIETIDAAIVGDKPQGIFDKATGRILVLRRARRIAAARNGSGIILDSRGIIATNTHTVRDSANIYVTFFNGARLPATILHHVKDQDISFISVAAPFALEPIPFANSDTLVIGMSVYAMGRSQWLSGTLTGGQIKSLGMENFNGAPRVTQLQITFQAYKGDSGSPILDGRGNLVGMINAGQAQGKITYALSSNLIRTAYQDYLRNL